MSTPSAPVPIETLLEHRSWVNGLAAGLLGHEADDLAQDTWVATLRRRPRERRGLRTWFGRVVRNQAFDRMRADRTRRGHEAAAREAGPAPAVADVVAEAELHRQVSDAVMALEEPYRSTVLLRYFEGLPPREAARRCGVPVETVRTRTRRALERLRRDLDARTEGGRAAWQAALLPLIDPRRLGAPTGGAGVAAVEGVLAMTTKTKIALAASVALALGVGAGWVGRAAAAGEQVPAERLETARTELAGTQDQVLAVEQELARVRRDLDRERQRAHALSERVDALSAELATARTAATAATIAEPASAEPDPPRATFAADAWDGVLSEVAWTDVGQATLELLPLMDELVDALLAGEELSPKTMAQMQLKNAPLSHAAMRITAKLPGEGLNGAYANPAFLTNLMRATLDAADLPLAEAQVAELDRLLREQLAAEDRLRAAHDETTFTLRRLYAEIASRRRFNDAALGVLSADQRLTIRPEKTSDRCQMDLFGSSVQWGLSVRRVAHDGTRESLAARVLREIEKTVEFAPERAEAVERTVHDWAQQLPEALLEVRGDGLELMGYAQGAHVTESTTHVLTLLERIARDVPLSTEARERLRTFPAVLVPYLR